MRQRPQCVLNNIQLFTGTVTAAFDQQTKSSFLHFIITEHCTLYIGWNVCG